MRIRSTKRPPQIRIHLDGLIVDSFAGGGGASLGIEMAVGRSPDVAINHNPIALAMHAANHPGTRHYCESVWKVDPRAACGGRPVALAWFSPDCKHFSKAKGGKPVDKKIRGLAGIVPKWARLVRPRVIVLENVEEFEDWGPLLEDGTPCPLRRGDTFRRWWRQMENLGYRGEMRMLRGCDYGAPTTRIRLFIVWRCDGEPISWPLPTHGPGLLPYRSASEIIDWSIPARSIFDRPKPLAFNTERRIARGLDRFVINAANPYIAPLDGGAIDGSKIDKVAAFLAKHNGGHEATGKELHYPIDTITARDHHSLVTASLIKYYGECRHGQPLTDPLSTITAQAVGGHFGLVRAYLIKYYGAAEGQQQSLLEPIHTITSKARFGLVTAAGLQHVIADISMRMLKSRELFRGQSFPDSYQIDVEVDGHRLTEEEKTECAGNSVCPVLAAHLVAAQFADVRDVQEWLAA